jgi:Fe-S cluster biosynthesis and repair protein YggX
MSDDKQKDSGKGNLNKILIIGVIIVIVIVLGLAATGRMRSFEVVSQFIQVKLGMKEPDKQIIERSVTLLSAPSQWGKPVPGALGKVTYNDNSKENFSAKIELQGLIPNHAYLLTLNGKKTHSSNSLLPEKTEQGEGFFNIMTAITDSTGGANQPCDGNLPPGNYDVKFFVKDQDDWKIVLHNDNLNFTVVK